MIKDKTQNRRLCACIARTLGHAAYLLFEVSPSDLSGREAIVAYIRSLPRWSNGIEEKKVVKKNVDRILKGHNRPKVHFFDSFEVEGALLAAWALCLDNPTRDKNICQRVKEAIAAKKAAKRAAAAERGFIDDDDEERHRKNDNEAFYYRWKLLKSSLQLLIRHILTDIYAAMNNGGPKTLKAPRLEPAAGPVPPTQVPADGTVDGGQQPPIEVTSSDEDDEEEEHEGEQPQQRQANESGNRRESRRSRSVTANEDNEDEEDYHRVELKYKSMPEPVAATITDLTAIKEHYCRNGYEEECKLQTYCHMI